MAELKVFYKGFDTQDWSNKFNPTNKQKGLIYNEKLLNKIDKGSSFTKTDLDLVIRDLNNHIFTEYGERVHMADFGTRIPSMTFEPADLETEEIIKEDLKMVFDYDPRVELMELDVLTFPDNNAMVAIVKLFFVELDVEGDLKLEFNG